MLKWTIALQLFTRCLTFLMNNQINRSVPPGHLGLISFKLDLLVSTVLALSRDALRLPALRCQRNNYTLIALALGTLVASLASILMIRFASSDAQLALIIPHFKSALLVTSAASLLDTFADPAAIQLILQQRIKEKVIIESTALIIKISFVLHCVKSGNASLKSLLITFSSAHLLYSITLILLHCLRGRYKTISSTFSPSNLSFSKSNTSKSQSSLLMKDLITQAYMKFFLAQGDRFIVASFSSLQDQGVYTVVSNYGSLILRTLMQPIEEASLQFFSQVKSSDPKCAIYLSTVLRALIYIGLVLICYASFFTDVAIYFVLGKPWLDETNAAASLCAYCYLVAFAGISGLLDAFFSAQITKKWINWQRKSEIGLSLIYCGLSIALINWKGSVGLISANTLNFILRSALSSFFIQSKMKRFLKATMIPKSIFSLFFSAYLINYILSQMIKDSWAIRIGVAGLHGILTVLSIFTNDNIFIYNFTKIDSEHKNKEE